MSVYCGGFHNGFTFIVPRLDKVQIVLLIRHNLIHLLYQWLWWVVGYIKCNIDVSSHEYGI